jgi:hypothetical protein
MAGYGGEAKVPSRSGVSYVADTNPTPNWPRLGRGRPEALRRLAEKGLRGD